MPRANLLEPLDLMRLYAQRNSRFAVWTECADEIPSIRCEATDKLTKQKNVGNYWREHCRLYFRTNTNIPVERHNIYLPVHENVELEKHRECARRFRAGTSSNWSVKNVRADINKLIFRLNLDNRVGVSQKS